MKVPNYYQNLLKTALQAAKYLEPITFVGMYDSGVDYLFPLIGPSFEKKLGSTDFVLIDLSVVPARSTAHAIGQSISHNLKLKSIPASYPSLTPAIQTFCRTHKLVLVVYVGQEGTVDPQLLSFLHNTRNLLGWQFSYILLATARLLFTPPAVPEFDKTLKRNLVRVLPLSRADATQVLKNYEERYGVKLKPAIATKVLTLAGGNPGLIKSLYLQAKNAPRFSKPDLHQESLDFRLRGILHDLPESWRKKLATFQKFDPATVNLLTSYGYLTQAGQRLIPFTPLLLEALATEAKSTVVDPTLVSLSKSERKVFSYLTDHQGKLISKDAVAEVLWGDTWEDRYSDWAIDQLFSTLRRKIAKRKLPGQIITKKGEGVIFISQK